ncbi:hypothetical protein ATDW_05380 [Asticcacaulis sp. DW145]|uniref:hypothetical protein n=1 Tax=Asticcacaulis sp. DW145 TaxID=3095608 RepID=UPI0030878374|nr:hypothetical protein ATDW_05380 [Asticcacaulis sp. DW145]
MSEMQTVAKFIESVRHVDKIKIEIGLPGNKQVGAYGYQRAASDDTTVGDWVANRIAGRLPDGTQVIVYTRSDKIAASHELIRFSRRVF